MPEPEDLFRCESCGMHLVPAGTARYPLLRCPGCGVAAIRPGLIPPPGDGSTWQPVLDLPDDAEEWHFEAGSLQFWMQVLNDGIELDERQQRAFGHAFDSAWRFMRKRDELEALRATMPAQGLPLPEEIKHQLFEATETWAHHFYSAVSALQALCVRYNWKFQTVNRAVPMSGVGRFFTWLEGWYGPTALLGILRRARDYRTFLAHPEQRPAYTWGYSLDEPRSIFLHGSGETPEGATRDHGYPLDDQWTIRAPGDRWVQDAFGFYMTLAIIQIIEDWPDGLPPGLGLEPAPAFGPIFAVDGELRVPQVLQYP